jgi:hypothetical protein
VGHCLDPPVDFSADERHYSDISCLRRGDPPIVGAPVETSFDMCHNSYASHPLADHRELVQAAYPC